MKKIFAIIMTLVMMLSTGACAAGIEIGLNSVTLTENNEVVMQLPDPGIRIAFAENENGMGLRAALVADGQTALEAVITIGAEKIMAGATGISDVYSVNLEQIMAIVAPYIENIASMIPVDIQPTEADMAIVGQLASIAEAAVTNGAYASEDGSTIGVKIGAEDTRAMWGLAIDLIGNHPEILEMAEIPAEALEELEMPEDIDMLVDASMSYTDAGIAAVLDLTLTDGVDNATIEISFSTDAVSELVLGFSLRQGDFVAMAANIVLGLAETDGAWIFPADTATVDVLTMSEAQLNKLMSEAQSILGMFGF